MKKKSYSKGQSATEYLSILAAVLILAVLAITTLDIFPSIGERNGESAGLLQAYSSDIIVDSFAVTTNGTLIYVRNNKNYPINISSIVIDNQNCTSSNLPLVMGLNNRRDVFCPGINGSFSGESYTYDILINWSRVNSLATFTQTGVLNGVVTNNVLNVSIINEDVELSGCTSTQTDIYGQCVDDVVFFYDFENVSAPAQDKSPNGYDGSFNAVHVVDVNFSYASFDGSNDYVDTIEFYNSTAQNFSVSAWVWVNSLNPFNDGGYAVTQQRVMGSLYSQWSVTNCLLGSTRMFFFNNNGGYSTGTCTGNFDTWVHLAFRYDVSTQTYEGFVDGVSQGVSSAVSEDSVVNTIKIGVFGSGADRWFHGYVDDVIIINRSITNAEVDHFHQNHTLYSP